MLQTIRDNSKGVVAGILVGFLVIIFALSGAEALFSGSSRSGEVVSVDGEAITENEVAREVYRQRQEILNQYGDSVPSEFVSDERLREPAVNALIQRKVLIQHAREQGMSVSDRTLDQLILSFPQFTGDDGQFDANRYQQVLRSMGYTPAQYKSLLRQELLLNQLSSGINASGFVTQEELERFAALNFQTRDFDYAVLTRDRVADEINVTDSDIEDYYQSNQQQFRQPEQIAVEYIDLSVDALMEQIDIDEQTLRDQYEQNQAAREGQKAERRVAHILFEDAGDERIEDVQTALNDGADFAELAEQYSDDPGSSGQGGDLGFVSGDGLPEEFMAAAESLEEGEVSAPVETEAGVHLIKVTDVRGAEQESFEEAREGIARQLKRVEAENEFVALMERLGELSYNADSLQSVADELDLPLETTELFGRNGGPGIAGESAVVEAAFSNEVLERNNSSDLLELANDRVVVVKKTEYQEAYIRPLEEVRERISSQLREERIRARLAERGEALREALESGQSLTDVAGEAELDVQEARGTERRSSDVSRSLVQHVFSLPKPSGDPVVSGVSTNDGYAIVVLRQAQDGQWADLSEEEQQSLRQNLAQMQAQEEYLAYREQLRTGVEVER